MLINETVIQLNKIYTQLVVNAFSKVDETDQVIHDVELNTNDTNEGIHDIDLNKSTTDKKEKRDMKSPRKSNTSLRRSTSHALKKSNHVVDKKIVEYRNQRGHAKTVCSSRPIICLLLLQYHPFIQNTYKH